VDSEWTVERHLLEKPPEVIALYRRFVELAEACGPFTYAVAKSAITLKGTRRGFAGAAPGLRVLRGYLDLPRRVEDERITRSSAYTKRLYVHHFRVDSLGQLDEQFAGWLSEAYQVGAGAHLAKFAGTGPALPSDVNVRLLRRLGRTSASCGRTSRMPSGGRSRRVTIRATEGWAGPLLRPWVVLCRVSGFGGRP
jgi:hypothetical protein